jgi:CRP-like cAMP-binding protein
LIDQWSLCAYWVSIVVDGCVALTMFVAAHMAGCFYFFLSYAEGLPADNEWIPPHHIRQQTIFAQYVHAVYWGFAAMTGNGSGVETPQTTAEHLFTLVVLLVGVSTYATLIGNLSSIIQQMNSKQEEFKTKMEDITTFMINYRLPDDVQTRVKSCFQYLYGMHPDTEGEERPARGEGWDVLELLPGYLRNEVLCHVNGEIITKVPLFRGCSDGFVRSLVPLLVPEVVIPGDYIIRTGEIGREMYLLRHGQLEVVAHGQVVATLSDGSYVGEVAIIFEQKRTASVRAVTFCDIMVLSKVTIVTLSFAIFVPLFTVIRWSNRMILIRLSKNILKYSVQCACRQQCVEMLVHYRIKSRQRLNYVVHHHIPNYQVCHQKVHWRIIIIVHHVQLPIHHRYLVHHLRISLRILMVLFCHQLHNHLPNEPVIIDHYQLVVH